MRPGLAALVVSVLGAAPVALAQTSPLDAVAARCVAPVIERVRQVSLLQFEDRRAVGVCVEGALPETARNALAEAVGRALSTNGATVAGGDRAALCARPDEAEGLRSRGVGQLLVLSPSLEASALRLRVTQRISDPGPWATLLSGDAPGTTAGTPHEESVELGPEQRRLFAPALPPRWPAVALASRPRTVATPFRDVVALALADLDGDRRDELVVLTPLRVHVARLVNGSLSFVTGSMGTSLSLGGVAPVPLREPMGRATPSTDRRSVTLSTSSITGTLSLGMRDGVLTLRVTAPDPSPADAVRWPREGAVVDFTVEGDGAGHAAVRRPNVPPAALNDVAPPFHMADLDGDQVPELYAASAGAPHGADRLRVYTVGAEGPRERPGLATPGPLCGIASGDLDGDGQTELVLAVGDPARRTAGLWVLP